MHTQIPQKCDAKRPCTTCVNSGRESGCFYDELRPPHVIRPLPYAARGFPFSDEDTLGSSSGGSRSYRLLGKAGRVTLPSGNPGVQVDRPVRSGPDPVGWDVVKLPSMSHTFQGSGSFVSEGTRCDGRSGLQHPTNALSLSASSRLFVLPSLRLSIVPRPLHTPLSFFPPENFQVAGETSGNLELSLYAFPTALLVIGKLNSDSAG